MGIVLLRLALLVLLPVLLTAVFYRLEKMGLLGRLSHGGQQAVIGIAFGCLAVISTEFSVPVDGVYLNVRDAAPLVSGLIFGWPSGLIAGLIGGVERWFAALWGVGEFTRLACSLATVLAGVIGAAVRRFMLDNKRASWFYGLVVGVTTEVLHMMLVFLTNADQLQKAFLAVRTCAVPMIVANGLSVMLSIVLVLVLSGRREPQRQEMRKIAQTFQSWLLVSVVLAFIATTTFTFFFQSNLASATADYTLNLNLRDVQNEIQEASDEHLLTLTQQISKNLPTRIDPVALCLLADQYGVAEINYVDENGIIQVSTNPSFVGYDMASGEQSACFLALLEGEKTLVQSYQPTSFSPKISRKYAGIALNSGGFLQVGYDAQAFQRDIDEQVVSAARNRHIGQNGGIIICDESGTIVSDRDGHQGDQLDLEGYRLRSDWQEGERFSATIYGESFFCMYSQAEGYYIIAILPESEALLSRDVSVYILDFMETIVFAILFVLIYILIKKLVVENIQKINRSLGQITGGNLDVTVDVRGNEEFASLSDDINSTVVTLKHYIDEAAARIDKELEFARQIQRSALPSVFPPYPNRRDFSIYASMDAAKEVGGDFYDFYLLDQDHLAFLVADVSGKGIPAAMFMMTAKTTLKGLAESGMEVHEVFTRANAKLCEGNDAGMFVTAWMGILDLKTGLLQYADAGHNPPVIRREDGAFSYLRTRPNFILAGMEGIKYRKNELWLHPGDEIYLYTDGVTEAQDGDNQLFGEERLLQSLNEKRGLTVEELCRKVKADVDAFVGEADQFDDITMLVVRMSPPENSAVLTVAPTMDSVAQVSAFLEQEMERLEVPLKIANRLMVSMDEIYSNIVRYSGAADAWIRCAAGEETLTLTFRDNGKPYNPLKAAEPDVTASAEDRPIGGLGIHLVKKMTRAMEYRHEGGWNILTLTFDLLEKKEGGGEHQ